MRKLGLAKVGRGSCPEHHADLIANPRDTSNDGEQYDQREKARCAHGVRLGGWG